MFKTNFVVKCPAQKAEASCSILALSFCFNRCIFEWVHKTFLQRKLHHSDVAAGVLSVVSSKEKSVEKICGNV